MNCPNPPVVYEDTGSLVSVASDRRPAAAYVHLHQGGEEEDGESGRGD